MRALLIRYPVASFFLLAFLLSWIAVLPVVLNPSLPVEPFQILGGFAGPTLSALLLLAATEGSGGIRQFFRRYLQWREGVRWWLLVLFGTLVAVTLVAAIIVGAEILTGFIRNIGLALITYLLTLVTGVILGPLWEEPGWRGFALPRLQSQYGPWLGTTILGVLWAAWHLPGYLGGWLSGSLFALLVSSIAFSIIMTWIYNNTHGSILLMILLHSSSNATLALGSFVLPSNMIEPLLSFVNNGWIPALTYAMAAVIVLLVTRGRLSYKTG